MAKPSAYTKREIAALKSGVAILPYYFSDFGIEKLGKQKLVHAGLLDLVTNRERYATDADDTAKHYLEHFKDQETHDRFVAYAAEYRKEGAWYAALAEKLLRLGLPVDL